ncbi:hypothetical protein AMATHDRAFT_63466, partial [Amanita thiersii Skay4041]
MSFKVQLEATRRNSTFAITTLIRRPSIPQGVRMQGRTTGDASKPEEQEWGALEQEQEPQQQTGLQPTERLALATDSSESELATARQATTTHRETSEANSLKPGNSAARSPGAIGTPPTTANPVRVRYTAAGLRPLRQVLSGLSGQPSGIHYSHFDR